MTSISAFALFLRAEVIVAQYIVRPCWSMSVWNGTIFFVATATVKPGPLTNVPLSTLGHGDKWRSDTAYIAATSHNRNGH